MARERLQIEIDAQVKGAREVEGLNKQLGGIKGASMSAKDALGAVASGAGIAAGIIVGLGAAAKATWDILGQGAELEAARGRFDNLSESIGITGDAMLGQLRTATKGMVSDAELIASATDIISLGLAKNEGDVSRLATVISTLGLDMQQVIMTFANNSTMRLDALGLSVENVTKRAEELEAQGFQGDAFDEAVLIELEAKMRLLGDASETTAGQMKIVEAAFKDLMDDGKQLASGLFEASGALEHMVGAVGVRNQLGELLAAGKVGFVEYEKMLIRATVSSEGLADVQRDLIPLMAELSEETQAAERAARVYADEIAEMEEAYLREQAAIEAGTRAKELAATADQVLIQNYIEHGNVMRELIDAGIDPLNERIDILRIREEELRVRVDEANISLDKQRTAVNGVDERMGAMSGTIMGVYGDLETLRAKLEEMSGREYGTTFTTRWEDIGTPPPFAGPGGGNQDNKTDPSKPTTTNDGARAAGGPVLAGMSYLVGEMGPETFVPNQSGTIVPGVSGPTINIYVNGGRGGMGMAQQVAGAVTDALGRLN